MLFNLNLYHLYFNKKVCPTCNNVLDKLSKRKFKCDHCGNNIYYRITPETKTEVLLSDNDFEIYSFYYSCYSKYHNGHKACTQLNSILYPQSIELDSILCSPNKFIPIVGEYCEKALRDHNLGLYSSGMYTLGTLYEMYWDHNNALEHFSQWAYLSINEAENNMLSLDLRTKEPQDQYRYINYSDLIYIYFLKTPEIPIDINKLQAFFCSIPLKSQITYRYPLDIAFKMIVESLEKYANSYPHVI